jgi:hypothetical protein
LLKNEIEKLISEYKESVKQLRNPPRGIPPSIISKWIVEADFLELIIEDLENILERTN